MECCPGKILRSRLLTFSCVVGNLEVCGEFGNPSCLSSARLLDCLDDDQSVDKLKKSISINIPARNGLHKIHSSTACSKLGQYVEGLMLILVKNFKCSANKSTQKKWQAARHPWSPEPRFMEQTTRLIVACIANTLPEWAGSIAHIYVFKYTHCS